MDKLHDAPLCVVRDGETYIHEDLVRSLMLGKLEQPKEERPLICGSDGRLYANPAFLDASGIDNLKIKPPEPDQETLANLAVEIMRAEFHKQLGQAIDAIGKPAK